MGNHDHRRIRSFVRRPGRITVGQRRALSELLPRFGVDNRPGRIDLASLFGRDARRVLDIGFGDGEALIAAAARFPDIDYLGVEVHEPGIGHLLVMLERAGLANVRIVARDVVDVIGGMLPDSAFAAVNLFFPDPWPKKRHHKRRLVQPAFVEGVSQILEPGGLFHVATDWADYAEHARRVIGESGRFAVIRAEDLSSEPVAFRAPTKFEARGLGLGHEVVDLCYTRRGSAG